MAKLITENSITIIFDAVVETLSRNDRLFEPVMNMLKDGALEQVLIDYIEKNKTKNRLPEDFRVNQGSLEYKDCSGEFTPAHDAISKRVVWMMEEGISPDPVLLFYKGLQENPSYTSQQELLKFLEANDLPLTEDGHFMAYKRVRDDYKDCHTGSISNHIGNLISMGRHQVNDDSSQTCSNGLHVCSLEYLKHFGGARLLAVKVHPANVVSVPTDYSNSKMRVCEYRVMEELPISLVGGDSDHWDTPVAEYEDEEE